mmetsp:Transcript_18535/g.24900  ORF Transcript_18535/g.24900 Transcript_18535/m.24900 type:complete len:138 (+) Transcript_18535:1237-1650(+)
MTVKNNQLGALTKRAADKNARNAALTAQLNKTGQRSMSNAFARAYFKRIARAFEVWKNWNSCDNHRQKIIRRTLEHYKLWNAKYLMAIFQNWKALANINDTKNHISDIEYQMNDQSLVQAGQKAEYEKTRVNLITQT